MWLMSTKSSSMLVAVKVDRSPRLTSRAVSRARSRNGTNGESNLTPTRFC